MSSEAFYADALLLLVGFGVGLLFAAAWMLSSILYEVRALRRELRGDREEAGAW